MSAAFFALSAADPDYGDFMLEREIFEHFAGVEFNSGVRLAGKFPATSIQVGFWRRALDYFAVGSVKVVSARLRKLLERERVNAEYLAIEVNAWPRFRRQYYFMNLLDVIACLDRESSRFVESTPEGGQPWILAISRLCLDAPRIGASRMFVLDEKVQILVREDLVNAIRSSGITGVIFRPLPDGQF